MNKTASRYLLLSAALACAIAPPIRAQSAKSAASTTNTPSISSGDELGDIIVTARRVEERLQDVPISIQVLSQESLSEHNVINSSELATYIPSLSANPNFGTSNTTFGIRGFNQDPGSPPSVAVYFADVVAPRGSINGISEGDGAGAGNFFDLQNVQVLKGPQGTLFGLNTTGGAVLFVPQKPTSEFGGYAEASYGNYSMHREQGALNLPISDSVRVRLAVDQERRDGYLNNDSGIRPARLGDVNHVAARASVVIDITPNLENYTIGSFTRSDSSGATQKLIACDPAATFGAEFACPQLARAKNEGFYTVQNSLEAPETLDYLYQLINTTSWRSGDALTIKNIASYAEAFQSMRNPLFGTDWPVVAGLPPIDFAVVVPAPGDWTSAESTFTDEIQFQGAALDDRLSYQGGLYFEGSEPISLAGSQSPGLISCTNSSALQCIDVLGIGYTQALGFPLHVGSVNYTAGETWYRDYAAYEQSTYAITDRLKVTAGARYTWDMAKNTSQRLAYEFPVTAPYTQAPTSSCTDATTAPSCYQTTSEDSHAPTWMLDLEYKPLEDILLYGKYSRGYRAGGVFPNSPANYRVFEPEKLDSFEAGVKSSFTGPVRGTFNLTGFYNNFRNQQLEAAFDAAPNAPVAATTGIVNAGKSKLWGAEMELTLLPFQGFVIEANYTYLRTEVTAIAPLVSTDPNYIVAAEIPVGAPLELAPKNKAVVSAEYTLPLPSAIGKISGGVTFSHTDKQLANYTYMDPVNVAAEGENYGWLAQRNLLDANASWSSIWGTPIDVSLFGTNLTNLHYYGYIPGLGSTALGFETAVLGEPRMFGVRLRYHFGKT